MPAAARLLAAVLLVVLVAAAGALSFERNIAGFQPLGFEATEAQGYWLVTDAPPASGLAAGDRILQVDGVDQGALGTLERTLRRRNQSELLVLRDGELVEVSHRLPPLAIDWPYLILGLIGLLYLGIGLYTLVRDRRAPARIFYLWCLASAIVYLVSADPPFDLAGRSLYLVEELARLLLAPLTLHLFAVFPGDSRRLRAAVPFFYLPAVFLILLQTDLIVFGGRWLLEGAAAAALPILDRLELLHLVLFGAAAVAVLLWRLRRLRDAEAQRQATWIAVGMAGGYLPFTALYVLPLTLEVSWPAVVTAAAVAPLALVPLTFAYAILRYKLWDIGVMVRGAVSLSLTVVLGVIGFSLANVVINRVLPAEPGLTRNLLSFVSGLLIAGLLVPARRGLDSSLERLQYRGRFTRRRALARAGRDLTEVRDLEKLAERLLGSLEAGLEVYPSSLLLLQGAGLVPLRPRSGISRPLAVDALGDEVWFEDVHVLSGVELPGEVESAAQELYAAGFRYAFPMNLRGKRVGVLLCGYREGEVPLSSDDVDLVRNLVDQAALAIENAELLDEVHRRLDEVVRLQRFNQRIFDASPAGIAVIDGDGLMLSANRAFSLATGRAVEIGRPIAEALPAGSLPRPDEGLREISFRDDGGGERYLQVSVAPLHAAADDPRRVVVVQDVSQRVAMEHELQAQERLASLGMLAAGVAHEVNTPITGISSYTQMLLAETGDDDPRRDLLRKVEKQTFRASRIVNSLLEFARDRRRERTPLALAPLVGESLDLLAERARAAGVRLEWQPPADPESIRVQGHDGELQQVLTNLVVNAIEAMAPSGGGRVAVGLEASQRWVWLTVEDGGPGMSAEQIEKVFEPFFSTKQADGGTGLGLSISHNIVRRHEGDLRVISHPGEGCRFVVELPRYHPKAARAERGGAA